MAIITTINALDKISDSRSVINTNFSNLNTDKIDKDGSVALAADWDAGEYKITAKEFSTDTISEETLDAGVTIDGVLLKDSQLNTDQINEKTADTGVTIDGVKLKDSQPYCDVINEKTADTGVTIDGVLLKDSQVSTDQINEKTAAAGVTIDSVLLKDGGVEVSAPVQGTAGNGYLELRGDSGATKTLKLYDSGIVDTGGQSRAKAHLSADQTITTATWTKVNLDVEDYDEQGEFDSTTNYRFTATKAGYYLVVGNTQWGAGVDQAVAVLGIYKNGTRVRQSVTRWSGTNTIGVNIADIIYLAANDYVELWAYHEKGSDAVLGSASTDTFMAVHKLS
jgi:hypothetical protein